MSESGSVALASNGHHYLHGVLERRELMDVLCRELVALTTQVYRQGLRALVLTGSLARSEGTFVRDGNAWQLVGDADVMAVFHPGTPLPPKADVDVIVGKIQDRLLRLGLRAEPTVVAVHPGYFGRLGPSIFAYELIECGRVLHGDQDVLLAAPRFSPAEIPLIDAWRLLANRMVEQLHAVGTLRAGSERTSAALYHRTVKLYLDMATSLLIFLRAYAPSYEARARTLEDLSRQGAAAVRGPFPLQPFATDVAAATRWKLSPDASSPIDGHAFWERAVGYAEALWHWELAQLMPRSAPSGDTGVMNELMRTQPLAVWLKGWVRVVRSRGWLMSARHWPRWVRQARHGSPRYLVYSAAASLLFMLPRALSSGASPSTIYENLAPLHALLPVSSSPAANGDGPPWARLAAEIVANYNELLVQSID